MRFLLVRRVSDQCLWMALDLDAQLGRIGLVGGGAFGILFLNQAKMGCGRGGCGSAESGEQFVFGARHRKRFLRKGIGAGLQSGGAGPTYRDGTGMKGHSR